MANKLPSEIDDSIAAQQAGFTTLESVVVVVSIIILVTLIFVVKSL